MVGAACALAACALEDAAARDALAGSEWEPLRLGTVDATVEDVEQFVRFEDEGRVVGHGGCNRFTGGYELEGDALTVGPLAATRMACPPPQMEREQALFAILDRTRGFRRDGTELTLLDSDGAEVASFRQRDWD